MVALRISLMDAFPGCKTSTFEARKNLVGFRKRGLCEARTDPAKHGLGECVSHNKSYTASGLVILCVTCIPASVAMSCHAADGELSVHEMVNSPGVADKSLNSAAVEAVQHFFTGGIGGCVGAAAVFPIDLVKTRQQAREDDRQTRETGPLRRLMSGFDCFTDIVRHEGPGGLYSGLSAQLIGVWPEKAVKLTANDFLRSFLTDPATGSLSAVAQIAAGAFGGLCQVVFTNPLEVVKIQLQLDGARLPAAGDRQHESANHASAAAGPTSGTRMRPTPGRSKSLLVEVGHAAPSSMHVLPCGARRRGGGGPRRVSGASITPRPLARSPAAERRCSCAPLPIPPPAHTL